MSIREITVTRRLPAARKLANDWRAFTKLMAECDELIEVEEVLRGRLRELRDRRPGAAPDIDISEAEVSEETKAQIVALQASARAVRSARALRGE